MRRANRIASAAVLAVFLFAAILIISPAIYAADCSNPPRGFGNSWAAAYKQWCENCCGTYSSSGPSCNPGSNWGCGKSAGGSVNSEAERQRGQAAEKEKQRVLEGKSKGAGETEAANKERQSVPFQKGLRDAKECYESSPRVYCLSFPAQEQNSCVEAYTAGYNAGISYQRNLLEAAFAYGQRDKENGKKNQSFNHPDATGSCRVKWIERYNEGYFKGKTFRGNK